jgi:hypothetical protein
VDGKMIRWWRLQAAQYTGGGEKHAEGIATAALERETEKDWGWI